MPSLHRESTDSLIRFQVLTLEQYVARDVSLGGSGDYLWVVIAVTWG